MALDRNDKYSTVVLLNHFEFYSKGSSSFVFSLPKLVLSSASYDFHAKTMSLIGL